MSVRVNKVPLRGQTSDGDGGAAASAVVVTWSAPERLNALTGAMMTSAADAVREADADESVLAVVFSGDPRSKLMSSGADLSSAAAQDTSSLRDSPALDFMRAVRTCRPLVCVAAHGAAVGIMLTILPHCDLAVADRSAFFLAPFGTLGICPEFAASRTLPQRMGRAAAMRLMLWGERFSAEEALRAGLLTELVDPSQAAAHGSSVPDGLVTASLSRVFQRLEALAATVARPSESARLFRGLVSRAAPGSGSAADLMELEMAELGRRVREGIPLEAAGIRAASRRASKL